MLIVNISVIRHDKIFVKMFIKFNGNLDEVLSKIQCVFVILLSLFVIRNFWGYMLIWRNAEGVHGQKKFENPCPKAVILKLCAAAQQWAARDAQVCRETFWKF